MLPALYFHFKESNNYKLFWVHSVLILLKGPEIEILCQNPITIKNGKTFGTLTERNPWPICSQPQCRCLGTKDLTTNQHLQVLRVSCNNTENYVTYFDINGNEFIAPKRNNCGTFRPMSPTFSNRCTCSDIGERK